MQFSWGSININKLSIYHIMGNAAAWCEFVNDCTIFLWINQSITPTEEWKKIGQTQHPLKKKQRHDFNSESIFMVWLVDKTYWHF
jgi:hypothetical protein